MFITIGYPYNHTSFQLQQCLVQFVNQWEQKLLQYYSLLLNLIACMSKPSLHIGQRYLLNRLGDGCLKGLDRSSGRFPDPGFQL
jgi:hypothetical protein